MRFVLHNPHVEIWYQTPVFHFLTRRKSVQKYLPVVEELERIGVEIVHYVDGCDSSFPRIVPRWMAISLIEYYLWRFLNKSRIGRKCLHVRASSLRSDDILFIFHYRNCTMATPTPTVRIDKMFAKLESTRAIKVVHMTHYMYNAGLGSINLKKLAPQLLIAENDIRKNSAFFREYFSWYNGPVLHLPFAAQSRFVNRSGFMGRKNRAVATGTLTHPVTDISFISFFQTSTVHPMRKTIYDRKSEVADQIDCYISSINETDKKKNAKAGLVAKLNDVFFAKQTKYFSFDIAALYNEYRMFVVPEEINDLPGIGFVEGMMCGSVFVGLDSPMYRDLGMLPGVHYIGYDGSFDDLVGKIKHYQECPKELLAIAACGYEFARSTFTSRAVAEKWLKRLLLLVEERRSGSV